MRLVALIIAFVLATVPVLAEDKVIVATCGTSSGCTCALSGVTATEAALTLGIDLPPPGEGEAKLVDYNGQMMWSRLSLRQINIVAGGNDDCPLQLFPEEAVVPLDGNWVATNTTKTIAGCPPGLDAMLPAVVKGMVFPRRMAWGGVFHPDKMRDPNAQQAIRWTQVTPRSFRGEPADLPASSPVAKITVDFQATLVSPEAVRGMVRMRLKSDAAGAGGQSALEMAGLANCLVVSRFDFRHVAP